MPKRNNKNSGGKGILILMCVSLMGAGVFAAYVKFAPGAAHVAAVDRIQEPDVKIDSRRIERSAPSKSTTQTDSLFVPAVVNNEVKLNSSLGEVPEGTKRETYLVNQTLASLMIDKAKVLDITTNGGLAMIHCTPEIQKGYGTMEEGNLIKALSMALGQFKTIKNFQIEVEGHTVESLGNIDLTTPVNVIRPGEKQDSNSSEESTPPKPN